MPCHRFLICSLFLLMLPTFGNAQVTLTGAADFGTDSSGATSVEDGYSEGFDNTLGGDQWWNVWMALNPDATAPLNGPSDEQASIALPLQAGQAYKYYLFGSGTCCAASYLGLNLFFDSNQSAPDISVFEPIDSLDFVPDTSDNLSLQGNPAPSAGKSFYNANGVVAVVTELAWFSFQKNPGNVAQPFVFAPNPDGEDGLYGSFSLRVFPAATFVIGQPSASPLSNLASSGSGFQAGETIGIYSKHIAGSSPVSFAVAGPDGSFSATVRLPQHPYGSDEIFALGKTSGNLGAARITVAPAIVAAPESVRPGGTLTAQGVGFGAGEVVSVYLDSPRQLLGTIAANREGSFVGANGASLTIPLEATKGLNALLGIGATTGATGVGVLRIQ